MRRSSIKLPPLALIGLLGMDLLRPYSPFDPMALCLRVLPPLPPSTTIEVSLRLTLRSWELLLEPLPEPLPPVTTDTETFTVTLPFSLLAAAVVIIVRGAEDARTGDAPPGGDPNTESCGSSALTSSAE